MNIEKRLRNIFDQYTQTENHLTNSLLLVFNHNRILMDNVLRRNGIKLTGKQVNLLSQIAPRKHADKSSVPDAYIYTEDCGFCVGIETKIEQGALRGEQLIGHLSQLAEYDHSFLLVLTPDEDKPQIIRKLELNHRNLRFISWIDLIKMMIEMGPDKKKNPVGAFVYEQFMSLMERHFEMTPFTGFHFREGFNKDLATHYVKRVSKNITPEIQTIYPKCIRTRPKMVTSGHPWEAWFPEAKVQDGVHFTFSVRPESISCFMVLGNGCKKEWKRLSDTLESESELKRVKKALEEIYGQAPDGATTFLSFRQRHYIGQTVGISDAAAELNIAMLLGVDGSKENKIWWNLLKEIAASKNRYNFQLEIGYDMPFAKSKDLKTTKALDLIVRCFKSLKPVYEIVTGG